MRSAICVLFVLLGSVTPREFTKLTDAEERFLEIPDANLTLSYMRALSAEPSLAGTPGALQDAIYIRDKFIEFGIPQVEIVTYETMLSYPTTPSHLEILNPIPFTAVLEEPVEPRDPTSSNPDIVQPYLSFSGSGDITADLVYVNYARPEDFDLLTSLGVSLEGKIGICRYGLMHRGLKPFYGMENGLSGLILYSDPNDDGYVRGDIFPDGPWRSPGSVQRGSARFVNLYSGDPLTPQVPALPGMSPEDKKYTYETTPIVPRIPILPIGYGDAQNFLIQLDGINVNTSAEFEDWQGGLPFDYHVGGQGTVSVRLFTQMEYPVVPIYNVIATIPGSEEPDRQVLLGGHHDGWTFGAGDPHSGTAPFLEVSRALGIMLREGWQPKRTIRIGSWDGEEHGLQGSTEWVEQFVDVLREEAVVYNNVDGSAKGQFFRENSTPNIYEVFEAVTKQITKESGRTIYDDWLDETSALPGILGSGSDYSPFLQFAGIAASDFTFRDGVVNSDGSIELLQSGTYHSAYDSIYWIDRFSIPENFKLATQVLGLLTLKFADAEILPFVYTNYADELDSYVDDVERFFEDNDIPLSIDPLRNSVLFFRIAAEGIENQINSLPKDSTFELRREINDRLMYAERGFLSLDIPLYRREEGWYKHVVYAPSFKRGYDAVVFPGVTEASEDLNIPATEEQLNVLTFQITEAARILAGGKLPVDHEL